MRASGSEEIDELLDELDHNLKRLRIEYEQFFLGQMKREPQVLRGKVQKAITKLVNEPPRNSRQKFRFNTLNSRFQVYRQLWGRTLREMEQGTYKRHQFRARMGAAPKDEPASAPAKGAGKATSMDRLYDAVVSARSKTGEKGGGLSRQALGKMVQKQMDAIRAKHGQDVRVKFKVVVEDNKAKLKASVSKS